MTFLCAKCKAILYGIVPDEWPFKNIFPITCPLCGEQQIITTKSVMDWAEVSRALDKALTARGDYFASISDNTLSKGEAGQAIAPDLPIAIEEKTEAQNNDISSKSVVNILTWRKKKNEMVKRDDN